MPVHEAENESLLKATDTEKNGAEAGECLKFTGAGLDIPVDIAADCVKHDPMHNKAIPGLRNEFSKKLPSNSLADGAVHKEVTWCLTEFYSEIALADDPTIGQLLMPQRQGTPPTGEPQGYTQLAGCNTQSHMDWHRQPSSGPAAFEADVTGSQVLTILDKIWEQSPVKHNPPNNGAQTRDLVIAVRSRVLIQHTNKFNSYGSTRKYFIYPTYEDFIRDHSDRRSKHPLSMHYSFVYSTYSSENPQSAFLALNFEVLHKSPKVDLKYSRVLRYQIWAEFGVIWHYKPQTEGNEDSLQLLHL
ncbi:hypothetical protein DFH07DRAFT_774064 [Mycena maculata]|uniref:Uncharacterized protein n=1 Tax=Mycena maculata TaxID=230809 RepID=A0AAD7NBS7_9AGAR|nr:hypothetical protein DFH07DRAFT_774064 [Mycena maculata]